MRQNDGNAAVANMNLANAGDSMSFPHDGPRIDQHRYLLGFLPAAAAPAQPAAWQAVATDERIELFITPSEIQHTEDDARRAYLSAGAALFTLGLVMHQLGYMEELTLLPDGPCAPSIARLTFSTPYPPSWDDHRFLSALVMRPLSGFVDPQRPLPAGLLSALPHLVTRADSSITFVTSPRERRSVIACLGRDDGTALGKAWPSSGAGKRRRVTWGPPDDPAPCVALIGSTDDSPRGLIAAGMTLQHLIVFLAAQEIATAIDWDACGRPTTRAALARALPLPRLPQLIVYMGACTPH